MKPSLKNIVNKKVLIINDEVDLCTLLKNYFLRKNCFVSVAHTEYSALLSIKGNVPDVILFDTTICKDPEEAIKKISDAAPDAKLIVNDSNNFEL